MYSPQLDRKFALLDMGMPEAWAEAYSRLYCAERPKAYGSFQWWQILRDAGMFWDNWGARAILRDWRPADVRNLFPVIRGREIVDLGFADVTFSSGDRACRRPVAEGAPIWQENRRAA